MIEIALDEAVLMPAPWMPVIHEYGEPLDVKIQVYALEEIVAEKLRAILQHAVKLEERGWGRSRARDYYDLWRIFGVYQDRMNLSGFENFLRRKCTLRNVRLTEPEDFYRDTMLAYVEKTWKQWLGPLVRDLPSFSTVINELRPQINVLFDRGP